MLAEKADGRRTGTAPVEKGRGVTLPVAATEQKHGRALAGTEKNDGNEARKSTTEDGEYGQGGHQVLMATRRGAEVRDALYEGKGEQGTQLTMEIVAGTFFCGHHHVFPMESVHWQAPTQKSNMDRFLVGVSAEGRPQAAGENGSCTGWLCAVDGRLRSMEHEKLKQSSSRRGGCREHQGRGTATGIRQAVFAGVSRRESGEATADANIFVLIGCPGENLEKLPETPRIPPVEQRVGEKRVHDSDGSAGQEPKTKRQVVREVQRQHLGSGLGEAFWGGCSEDRAGITHLHGSTGISAKASPRSPRHLRKVRSQGHLREGGGKSQ